MLNANSSLLLKVDGVMAPTEHALIGIEFSSVDEESENRIRHITFLNMA
ncbi:MAG: hypothetical protein WBX11_13160 [Thiobacillaceae bacterium]